ncbi:MAG: hypothetical protein A3H97_24600 [Acidobacteria bacterium RIFCSPLOWO2_02_FULL_65_29]|nr:MAG: hypothetical protein A3H97_24600 [Acidobacteria bacterium RIFCSPLOWO2_02_FULL_65_29]
MVQFRAVFLKRTVLVLAVVVAIPYLRGPLYDFPAETAFAGAELLNPYAALTDPWQRANLHAHGRVWSGLTNGRQPDAEIVRAYESLGYSVAGVSNYQRIATDDGVPTMPLYEHGYNLGKRHQLAIGARQVSWFDFPLWQTRSHQQFVIHRVAETADLVALAHPAARDAYTTADLRQLTGYHLMEVVNGPFLFEESWDAALSAGRAVWALANDDTHDLTDPRRTAVAWTMINAPSASASDIVDALRAGRAYAVSRTNEIASAVETVLGTVTVDNDTIEVTCEGEPSTFIFIGQNGVVRKSVKEALAATYTFGHDDTYIRTVIRSPRTAMFLNPVLRHPGGERPPLVARVDVGGTWRLRAGLVLAGATLALLFRDRRRPVPALPPRQVLAPADRKTA